MSDPDYDREFDEAVAAAAKQRRAILGVAQIVGGMLLMILGATALFLTGLYWGYGIVAGGFGLVVFGIRTVTKGEEHNPDVDLPL